MQRIARPVSSEASMLADLDPSWQGRAFLSPREVAEITGLHVAVVRRAVERGELRAHKLCSRLRIRREDFEDWLERSLVRP